jgi:hypothetical protein
MKRQEFIAELGGAAAWSATVRAQPGARVRRISSADRSGLWGQAAMLTACAKWRD